MIKKKYADRIDLFILFLSIITIFLVIKNSFGAIQFSMDIEEKDWETSKYYWKIHEYELIYKCKFLWGNVKKLDSFSESNECIINNTWSLNLIRIKFEDLEFIK